jgi:hypothetical protein
MAQQFDVDGARKAGYSDDEIIQHLSSSRNFDVDGARQAGYSSQEIIDHLSSAAPPTGDPNAAIKAAQARKYPTAAETGGKPGAVAPSRTLDPKAGLETAGQAGGAFLRGIPQAVTGLPSFVKGAAKAGISQATGGYFYPGAAQEFTASAGKAAVAPFVPAAKIAGTAAGAGNFPVTDEDIKQGAEAGGATLGGEILGGIAGQAAPTSWTRGKIARFRTGRPLVSSSLVQKFRAGAGIGENVLDDAGLDTAIDDTKAQEAKTGQRTRNVTSAIENAKAASFEHSDALDTNIIQPNGSNVVPGSNDAIRQAHIDAAGHPGDPGLMPDVYNQKIADINARFEGGRDLTIDELNQRTVSGNEQLRSFYKKGEIAQLTDAERESVARLKADTDAARNEFYRGLDLYNPGGGVSDAARAIKERVGNLIRLQDALESKQAGASIQRAEPTVSPTAVGRGLARRFGFGREAVAMPSGIDPAVAEVFQRWTGSPDPYPSFRLQKGLPPQPPPSGDMGSYVRGTSEPSGTPRLLTAAPPAAPAYVGGAIPTGPVPDTSYVAGTPPTPAEMSTGGRPRMLPAEAGGPYGLPETTTPPTRTSSVTGTPATPARGPFTGQPIEGQPQAMPGLPPDIEMGKKLPANPPQGRIFAERQSAVPPKSAVSSNDAILNAVERLARKKDARSVRGMPVSARELRQELPNMSKEELDKAIVGLAKDQKLFLTQRSLDVVPDAEEVARNITNPDAPTNPYKSYVAVALRDEPRRFQPKKK